MQRVFSVLTLCTLGALAPVTASAAPTPMGALEALTPASEAADAPATAEQLTEEEVAGQDSVKDPAWVDTMRLSMVFRVFTRRSTGELPVGLKTAV